MNRMGEEDSKVDTGLDVASVRLNTVLLDKAGAIPKEHYVDNP